MKFLDWLLNKASPGYAETVAGGKPYWDDAAREQATFRLPENSQPARETSSFDPVYGLTSREVALWLGRNPRLQAKYQAEVASRQQPTAE